MEVKVYQPLYVCILTYVINNPHYFKQWVIIGGRCVESSLHSRRRALFCHITQLQ